MNQYQREIYLTVLMSVFIGLAVVATTVFAAEKVGEVIYRYTGAEECIVMDPEAGEVLIKENVRPNDQFTIRQFVTNRCENTIQVEVALSGGLPSYITVSSQDIGTFSLPFMDTTEHLAVVTFGNDTPANFSAKDVAWKVERPE